MSSPSAPAGRAAGGAPRLPTPRAVVAALVVVPAVVALALWAFAWPSARTAPHDLPLGVAGPAAAVEQVEAGLSQRGDAFDVHTYPDADTARDALTDREVYAALVVTGADAPQLLTASAAGPAVAQSLVEVLAPLAPEGAALEVEDVVPAPENDPRGSTFGASVLPLTLGAVFAGAASLLLGLRRGAAAGMLVAVAAAVGAVLAAIGHSWLGAFAGNWWAVAGAAGLVVLAGAATVGGLAAWRGPAGIGLGAALLILLGNPWSGAATAPEMLPEPAGTLGQWLPPGAGATLLRSVSFFDGAGAGFPLLVLGGWAVLGLTAVLLARRPAHGGHAPEARRSEPVAAPAP